MSDEDLSRRVREDLANPKPITYSLKVIGAAQALHRKRLKMSQEDAAKNLGWPLEKLESLEKGLYLPSEDEVIALCASYGLHPKRVLASLLPHR